MTSRRVRSWSDDDASRGSDSPAPQTFTWEDRAVALLCAAARRGDAFSGPTGLGRRILGFDEPCAACLAHVDDYGRGVVLRDEPGWARGRRVDGVDARGPAARGDGVDAPARRRALSDCRRITALAVRGNTVVVGDSDGRVYVAGAADAGDAGGPAVDHLSLSADARYVAAPLAGAPRVWRIDDGDALVALAVPRDETADDFDSVRAVVFVGRRRVLYAFASVDDGAFRDELVLLDVASMEKTRVFAFPASTMSSTALRCAATRDGAWLCAGNYCFHEVPATGAYAPVAPSFADTMLERETLHHGSSVVWSCCFLERGDGVTWLRGVDRKIFCYEVSGRRLAFVACLEGGFNGPAYALSASPCGRYVASGGTACAPGAHLAGAKSALVVWAAHVEADRRAASFGDDGDEPPRPFAKPPRLRFYMRLKLSVDDAKAPAVLVARPARSRDES